MIPLGIRAAIALLEAGLLCGSFAIHSSVDRGLSIRRDRAPALGTDAATFSVRVMGAVIPMAGLLTWVVGYTAETHRGIF